MKHALPLFFLVLALVMGGKATAAGRLAVPADTTLGHAHLVNKISKTMCQQLTNDHTTAIDKLSQPEVLKLTEQLFTTALQADSVAMLAMMAEGAKQNKSAQTIGQELGRDAVIQLSRTCSAARPLIVRLGQTDQAKQAAVAELPVVGDTEKKVLQPVATTICTKLTATNAKVPLAKRTPAEREQLLVGLLQHEITASRPQLLRYYSAAQLADKQALEEIIRKLYRLLLTQSNCSSYMALFGADELAK